MIRLPGPPAVLLVLLAAACSGDGGDSQVSAPSFPPVDPLLDVLVSSEVDAIVQAAAESVDASQLAVAVVDRRGNLLRLWNRDPLSATSDFDNRIAVSLARAAALLSTSQAPMSSRACMALSSHHWPALFNPTDLVGDGVDDGPGDVTQVPDINVLAYRWRNIGVKNTPQGPFWQIDVSHRGATLESALTTPATAWDAGQDLPLLANPDGTTPSPGLTPLPGGIPLYKRAAAALAAPGTYGVERSLVGGIGVFATDPLDPAQRVPLTAPAEYAALSGARALNPLSGEDYTYGAIPGAGVVFYGGVLIPYVGQSTLPAGFGPGTYSAVDTVAAPLADGLAEPTGWLVSPRDSASATAFTGAEVDALVQGCAAVALESHSGLRVPSSSPPRFAIAVTDVDGVILGLFRMQDAAVASVEGAVTQARNCFYYSNPLSVDSADQPNLNAGLHPLRSVFVASPAALALLTDPSAGIAMTTRALGLLSQPFHPAGIDASTGNPKFVDQPEAAALGFPGGPLYNLSIENRKPYRFNQMGFSIAADISPGLQDNTQTGLALFPGGVALYRDGALIGGLGVCGDGPLQNDLVVFLGIRRAEQALELSAPPGFDFEPPAAIRCDNFSFAGVALPYLKFPQNPEG